MTVSEVAGGLIGLFLVAMVFYVESGFRRLSVPGRPIEEYFRASTRIVLVLFAIPLLMPLTLVALPVGWSRFVFAALVVALAVTNVTTFRRVRSAARVTGSRTLVFNEWVGTLGVVLVVTLPVISGGLTPGRSDFVPAVLLALGVGFLSTCVLVLSLFDVARLEEESG